MELLARQGGIARVRDVRRAGLSRRRLHRAVEQGRLRRLTPHLVTDVAQPAPDEQLRAAAVGLEGTVSHTSAALLWGIELATTPRERHVTVARPFAVPPQRDPGAPGRPVGRRVGGAGRTAGDQRGPHPPGPGPAPAADRGGRRGGLRPPAGRGHGGGADCCAASPAGRTRPGPGRPCAPRRRPEERFGARVAVPGAARARGPAGARHATGRQRSQRTTHRAGRLRLARPAPRRRDRWVRLFTPTDGATARTAVGGTPWSSRAGACSGSAGRTSSSARTRWSPQYGQRWASGWCAADRRRAARRPPCAGGRARPARRRRSPAGRGASRRTRRRRRPSRSPAPGW